MNNNNNPVQPFLLFEILHGGDLPPLAQGDSNWKILSIQAVLSFIFGNLTLLYPSLTLAAFITLFASFTMISGSITISQSLLIIANELRDRFNEYRNNNHTDPDPEHIPINNNNNNNYNTRDTIPTTNNYNNTAQQILNEFFNLIEGLVSIAIGTAALLWPEITAMLALYLIAAWALITGAGMLAQSGLERHSVKYYVIVGGMARLFLGALLYVVTPQQGVLAVLWAVGIQAIVNGFLYAAAAIHSRIVEFPTAPVVVDADHQSMDIESENVPLLNNNTISEPHDNP